MFPLTRVIYMPLSPSTTFLQPISTDCSASSTISLYNPSIFNPSFPIGNCKFLCRIEETNEYWQAICFADFLSYWIIIKSMKWQRIFHLFIVEQKSYSSKRISQRKRWKFNDTNKNALMLLYDVQPSIEYKLIARTGPSHRPTFTMSVEIHGQIFQGTGPTKREAKQAGKTTIIWWWISFDGFF